MIYLGLERSVCALRAEAVRCLCMAKQEKDSWYSLSEIVKTKRYIRRVQAGRAKGKYQPGELIQL